MATLRSQLWKFQFHVSSPTSFCSVGEPVELSSKFIRYSTFKTGKEQLVRCPHPTPLYHMTMIATPPIPTGELWQSWEPPSTFSQSQSLWSGLPQHVPDDVSPLHHGSPRSGFPHRELPRLPQKPREEEEWECHPSGCCQRCKGWVGRGLIYMWIPVTISDVIITSCTEIQDLPRCSTGSPSGMVYGTYLTIPRPNGVADLGVHTRTASESCMSTNPSISGIFFAIKHWISKHYYVSLPVWYYCELFILHTPTYTSPTALSRRCWACIQAWAAIGACLQVSTADNEREECGSWGKQYV